MTTAAVKNQENLNTQSIFVPLYKSLCFFFLDLKSKQWDETDEKRNARVPLRSARVGWEKKKHKIQINFENKVE